MRARVLCPKRPTTRAPATCRASETGLRLSAIPGCVEERRGPPRLRDRPLCACHGRTPRRLQPPLPNVRRGPLLPSGKTGPSASGTQRFRGRIPMAHTFACLRFAERVSKNGARLATGSGGLTLGRAGFAPAGRCTKFHGGIAAANSLRPTGPGRTDLPIRLLTRNLAECRMAVTRTNRSDACALPG